MAAAGVRADDVNRVLTFGREKLAQKQMLFAGIAAAVGFLGVLVADDDAMLFYVSCGLLAFGVGFAGWEFSKTTGKQKPLLVLSPEGLRINIEGATEFTIPWIEVHGVDAITVEGLRGVTFDNVTAVVVTRDFYDRVIHVDSFIRRGPGWDQLFIPRDGMMLVALHHAWLPVKAADLLAAVEARYRAFGRPPEASTPGTPDTTR
jgi:hypothetical protein